MEGFEPSFYYRFQPLDSKLFLGVLYFHVQYIALGFSIGFEPMIFRPLDLRSLPHKLN